MNFIIQFLLAGLASTLIAHVRSDRSFYIDYEKNTFVKDSTAFRYISGSIHPYRVPKQLWEDRLKKMWAGGLNAIQIYIFWNEHEPQPGVYDFEGQNNIFEFLEIAQKIGFVVVLRPGPYVCAEHDYGGLPWWLLVNGTESIVPRSSETNYMNAVRRYFGVLLPQLAPYLYKNGGPIITVQVENEYGSYYTCDKKYTGELRDLFKLYFGDDVVLFTTDPPRVLGLTCGTVDGVYATVDFGVSISPNDAFEKQRKFSKSGPLVNGGDVSYLKCGYIYDVYPTVDFGPSDNVNDSFDAQRSYAKYGPLVNSEFYPGWLDFWGTPHQKVPTDQILKSFNQQLDMGANVNFYMYFGGTNFGFSNGADPPYLAEPTSYDYDAPLSEPADITNKYLAIRDSISKYMPLPPDPIPANSTKLALGKVKMQYHVPLLEAINDLSYKCVDTQKLNTFENLGQGYGFVMYRTTLDDPNVDGKILSVKGIRDRGYVMIGSTLVGVVYRAGLTEFKINLQNNKNKTLTIVVENMGRLNFGNNLLDTKGIVSNVTLDNKVLSGWTSCLTDNFVPYYQKNVQNYDLVKKYANDKYLLKNKKNSIDFGSPAIYIGEFDSPNMDYDTFMRMDKFTKGVALIRSNDTLTNLGRYWPKTGPQVTLYTPSVFTTLGTKNYLVLIEFEGASCTSESDCLTEFIDYPIIDNIPN
ncbi:Beta-galactosidase [Brachionus plicatilis]|uniref:Beta-galactosidase n=1 Tax=Brachionus plicatilis TaxID=10195 RepID=A0A3M7RFP5_BRAPC|nr:Beta-galactosidase [Brachionus plicatilis]